MGLFPSSISKADKIMVIVMDTVYYRLGYANKDLRLFKLSPRDFYETLTGRPGARNL